MSQLTTNFFLCISNLATQQKISLEQKLELKTKLIQKNTEIQKIIQDSGQNQENLQQLILEYLNIQSTPQLSTQNQQQQNNIQDTYQISNGLHNHLVPAHRKNLSVDIELAKNQINFVSDLCTNCENFEISLITEVSNKGLSFSQYEKKKLQKLRKFIAELLDQQGQNSPLASPHRSPLSNSPVSKDSINDFQKVVNKMKNYYKEFKYFFNNSMTIITSMMEENIQFQQLVKLHQQMTALFFGYDQFSFIFIKSNNNAIIYQTESKVYQNIEEISVTNQLQQQIKNLPQNTFFDFLKTSSQLKAIIKPNQCQKSIGFVINNPDQSQILFLLHQDQPLLDNQFFQYFLDQKSQIPNIHEIYKDYALLVTESIHKGFRNYFNPVISASIITDITSRLMNRMGFLYRECLRQELSKHLVGDVVIETTTDNNIEQESGGKLLFTLEGINNQNFYFYILEQIFLPKNLSQYNDQIKYKYDNLIRLILIHNTKIMQYKYFIKNSNPLILDFNKTGELVFINFPIPENYKQKYNMQITQQLIDDNYLIFNYIFKNEKIQQELHKLLQDEEQANNYIQSQIYPDIEYYVRRTLNKNEGYMIIIHEEHHSEATHSNSYDNKSLNFDNLSRNFSQLGEIDEVSEIDLDQQKIINSKIQKVVTFQETIEYLQQLNQKEPSVNNSQLQMFYPSEFKKEGQIKKEGSLIMSRFDTNKKYRQKKSLSPAKIKQFVYTESIFESRDGDNFIQSLDWNALTINSISEMHRQVWNIFNRENWLHTYKIPVDILIKFLQELERKYNKNNNPFHNYLHGIAVMQGAYAISNCKVSKQHLNDFQRFVLTFSGLCHDVAHPGRTNLFMVNSMDKLAIRYHDDSVLERHHAAQTFHILQKEKFNIFSNITTEEFKDLRKQTIENILYTDISKHFPLLKDFAKTFKVTEDQVKKQNTASQKRQSILLSDISQIENGVSSLDIPKFGSGQEDIKYLRGMILHTADFVGGAKPFEISRVWSEKVNLEFSAQYEEEGKLGITQTPFLKDLDQIHVMAKGEMGFFKFIVQPLWVLMNEFVEGELQKQCDDLQNSVECWQKIYDENNPENKKDQQQQIKN